MSFTAQMDKFCRTEAPDKLDRTVRTVVLEVGNRAVYRSPTGDPQYWDSPAPPGYVGGRFKGNWQYGFSSKPTSYLNVIDGNGSATLAAITSSVLSGNAVGVHYITNNSPYAKRIEDGWSKRQAPYGIVGRIELEFPAIVRRAKAS